MNVGKKIREFRRARNWTLADLAKRSGVALSSLSRIETGKMTGTLASHLRIARTFGIRVAELYADLDLGGPAVELRRLTPGTQELVQGKGASLTVLTSSALRKKILPLLVSLRSGRTVKPDPAPVGAERFLYLVKGELEVTIGKETFRIHPGDSLYFQASLPHQLKGVSSSATQALSITSPPAL